MQICCPSDCGVLADAAASCRALDSLSISSGCEPQVSGWGRGPLRYGVLLPAAVGLPLGWDGRQFLS